MNKKALSLSLVAGLTASTFAVGFTTTTAAELPGGEAVASVPTGDNTFFSAVEMETDTVERLLASGKTIQQPEPKNLDKLASKKKFDRPEEPKPLPLGPIGAEQNTLAVLVKFPTQADGSSSVPGASTTRVPAELFNDLLFGTEYNPYTLKQGDLDWTGLATYNGITAPTDRTLYNYYKEVSYGKLNVTTKDAPVWVEAPHPYEYYFGGTGSLPTSPSDYNSNGFGNYPHNVQGLVQDVMKAVDDQVDFSQYAINGKVPGVFVIHEGTGGEFSGDPQQFWSHKWQLAYKWNDAANDYVYDPLILDGVEIDTYSMEPEVGGDLTGYSGFQYGPIPPYVGVYAHEFAHVLGLPDLYDYGYDSQGVGAWSVMAGGSWTRYPNSYLYSGNTPVHLDAWNKYFAGFAEAEVLPNNGKVNFSLESSVKSPKVYKVDVPRSNGSEYFLIENRQQEGYDIGLSRYGSSLHGLAVWHVDDNVLYRTFSRPNEAENRNPVRNGEKIGDIWGVRDSNGEHHYGVSLVQADGKFELERNLAANGGDVFPGTTGKSDLVLSNNFYSGSFYNWPGSNGTGFFSINGITEANGVVTGSFNLNATGSYIK